MWQIFSNLLKVSDTLDKIFMHGSRSDLSYFLTLLGRVLLQFLYGGNN